MARLSKAQKALQAFKSHLGDVKQVQTEGLKLWRVISGTETSLELEVRESKRGNTYFLFVDGDDEFFCHTSDKTYEDTMNGVYDQEIGQVVEADVVMLEPVPNIDEDDLIKHYGKDSVAYNNYKSAIKDGEKRIKIEAIL